MGKSQPPGLFYHQGDNDNVNLVISLEDENGNDDTDNQV